MCHLHSIICFVEKNLPNRANYRPLNRFKGIVNPKLLIYSPVCCSKPAYDCETTKYMEKDKKYIYFEKFLYIDCLLMVFKMSSFVFWT